MTRNPSQRYQSLPSPRPGAVGGGFADVEPGFLMGSLDGSGSGGGTGRGERPMSGIGLDSGEWAVK